MKRNALHLCMSLALLTCPWWVAAHADTIGFALTSPTQTVDPGGTLSFAATLNAPLGNTAPVYLNGDTYDITAPVAVSLGFSALLYRRRLAGCGTGARS